MTALDLDRPASFAYADPPYLGRGVKDYGPGTGKTAHPEAAVWDDPQSHVDLLARLCDEYPDGWAVSLHLPSLRLYLAHAPADCRVGVYAKTYHQILVNVPVQYAWEPVLWRGGRKHKNTPMVRDWIAISTRDAGNAGDGFKGSKPAAFNRWVADLLGYRDGDTLTDLFPGTGGMARTLAQGVLA